jgi:hypothetical protein
MTRAVVFALALAMVASATEGRRLQGDAPFGMYLCNRANVPRRLLPIADCYQFTAFANIAQQKQH